MKLKLLVIFYLYFCSASSQSTFENTYPEAYLNGLQNCLGVQKQMDSVARSHSISSGELLSIVFPEMARYSLLQDAMETTGLEILYVNYGQDYANFSIGIFQMKPSFAEELEGTITTDTALKSKFNTLIISENDSKKTREIRISRLKEKSWQMLYLCAFYQIVKKSVPAIHFTTTVEKTKYFATAYNFGFTKDEEEIRSFMSKKLFPATSSYPEDNFSYGEIAAQFYTKHFKL